MKKDDIVTFKNAKGINYVGVVLAVAKEHAMVDWLKHTKCPNGKIKFYPLTLLRVLGEKT